MSATTSAAQDDLSGKGRRKVRKESTNGDGMKKRRCISSACVPCRKRKSKCDGTKPACSACAAVYNTECVYDLNSDHRRKGVYRNDSDELRASSSALRTLIHAILNYPEEDVPALVHQIRTCESLEAVAESITAKENDEDELLEVLESPAPASQSTFESQLSGKMGELRLEDGSTRYIGGTSHLIYMGARDDAIDPSLSFSKIDQYAQTQNPLTSWTSVTSDPELVDHLINMYFCWHYSFFTTLPKHLFFKEFHLGKPPPGSRRKTEYCSSLLVNAMLALGCHFTSRADARAVRDDSATAGDHFFREAKRLILENDLHEVPTLTTVQALALMSVREAGCGREAKGWVYSGMSFRMACDLGLNLGMASQSGINELEEDARRITFWGCFLFDKCWSNYLGRLPQLPKAMVTVPKPDVFPTEESEIWSAYTDSGMSQAHSQPSRTRAIAIQISRLCEISSDLMNYFYNPIDMDKAKGKQAELKKLSEIHQRLESWRRELPKELEPREGGLPSMLVMHMFFQLLYIHLFRPFLKYNPDNSPLPSNVSPRKLCTQAAAMISKLLRLYKRSHGLRQICNIVVYIAHSACTIHLLNLPEKNAKRDVVHGVKHLEEIAESWLCARRTLGILSVLARRWNVELPEEAATVLSRTDAKFGPLTDIGSPKSTRLSVEATRAERPQIDPLVMAQPYAISVPNVATHYSGHAGVPLSSTHHSNSAPGPAPRADSFPLPSHNAQPVARSNTHPNAIAPTPANFTAVTPPSILDRHHSADTAPTNSDGSPSRLFGGPEQPVQDARDWWLRDQNQLAFGFDNWDHGVEDIAGWFAGQQGAGVGSPGFVNPGVATGDVGLGMSDIPAVTSGDGVIVQGQGQGQGQEQGQGHWGSYGEGMTAYNEQEWYQ